MPSGPPELHEYWCARDERGGDIAAQHHLQSRGFTLTKTWSWRPPWGHQFSDEDNSAINYLCWEWDFGGVEDEEAIRALAIAEALTSRPPDSQSMFARAMVIADRMRADAIADRGKELRGPLASALKPGEAK